MAKTLHIIAAGNSPQAAKAINSGIFSDGSLTAAGTTKATSLVLPGASNYFSITSSGKGASFSGDTFQGDEIEVYNGGSNPLLIYTTIGTSDTITNLSANGGFTISALKGASFRKVTSSLYMVNYSK